MPLGFPGGASGKKTHTHKPAGAGDIRDTGLIPGLGVSPEEGYGNLLQCPCLENPMDRGTWQATVHRVTKSQTKLSGLASMQDAVSYKMRLFYVSA